MISERRWTLAVSMQLLSIVYLADQDYNSARAKEKKKRREIYTDWMKNCERCSQAELLYMHLLRSTFVTKIVSLACQL